MTNADVLRKIAETPLYMKFARIMLESEARLAAVLVDEALAVGDGLNDADVYALFAVRDSLNTELGGRLARVRAA